MALIHVDFFSSALGMSVNCDVILPQQASRQIGMAAASREGKHPVLWLLHGASDDHTIWQRRTSIERYAAPLGLAVVMPAAHLSSYSDMSHGGNFYTYISQELPHIMRDFFPFSEKREDNYIAGLSMGGAGCMKIGLANPQNYAAIGCLSAGAFNHPIMKNPHPEQNRRQFMLYGGRDLEGTEEDILGNARKIVENALPAPRIYHACGTEDFLLKSAHATRDFFQSLPGNPFDYTYDEGPGAHTWEFWDDHIQTFLKFIGSQPVANIRN